MGRISTEKIEEIIEILNERDVYWKGIVKMSRKKKHEKAATFYELQKQIRGDWNGVNPVTRVFKSKKEYTRKEKHPKDYRKEYYNED